LHNIIVSIYHTTTDLCQHCLLANSLPFQSLNDLEHEFTVSKGINISEEEMDRLMHLKFKSPNRKPSQIIKININGKNIEQV
jgi:hypothetical protein